MLENIKRTKPAPVFQRINILIILVACIILCIGFALMAGGGSSESAFCADIFSHRRIVIAPLICLLGYLMVVVGIVYHGNDGKTAENTTPHTRHEKRE